MKKGELLRNVAASSAILLFISVTHALAAEGMSYGSPPPPQTVTVPGKTTIKTNKSDNAVRPELVPQINDAINFGKKKDFTNALAKIKEADASVSDKSSYEEYVITKLMGQFAGELHDDATAAMAFNRALASNAMPDEERPPMLEVVLALNINTKDYAKAVAAGEELRRLNKLKADDTVNLALAYYDQNDYSNAIKNAKTVLSQDANNSLSLQILRNSQIKTGDQPGARQTTAKLCSMASPPPEIKCPSAK